MVECTQGVGILMNIDYCREFIELAQCLNFTEAARSLNITQPALSKHVLSLEREFGADLLDRSRKGVQLTEAGRVLFENASIIVNAYDNARQVIDALKAKSPVRIAGHMEDSDVSSLASLASMIARERHQVTAVFERAPDDPFDLLESGEIDLFVGYTLPEKIAVRNLASRPFLDIPLVAVVGTYHGFAAQPAIAWDDLRNETLVQFVSDKTNPAWEQIEAICERHGFSPKTRPVSSLNDVEFFSTPLRGSVLVWKKTQRQLLIETGQRACIPLVDDDARLTAYAVYRPESEEHLREFFDAVDEAKTLMKNRKDRREG